MHVYTDFYHVPILYGEYNSNVFTVKFKAVLVMLEIYIHKYY